jgi:hypothetical protein
LGERAALSGLPAGLTAGWYRAIRLILWAFAVGIASFPAIIGAFDTVAFTESLLRDIIFIVIPASALGLSSVVDYLCMNYQVLGGTQFALAMGAILFNILGMFSGLVGFLEIPNSFHVVTTRELVTFSVLICLSILISIITEYLVSADNHRCHTQHREAQNREPHLEPSAT